MMMREPVEDAKGRVYVAIGYEQIGTYVLTLFNEIQD